MSQNIEFGQEFVPFAFGLGGVVEGVANKLNQMFQTPSEKFFVKLHEAFETISSLDQSLPLSQINRYKMEQFAEEMNHMPYKNATTFVLGCLSTLHSVSGALNERVLAQRIFPLLPSFKDSENISQFDVLRYARFAMLRKFSLETDASVSTESVSRSEDTDIRERPRDSEDTDIFSDDDDESI